MTERKYPNSGILFRNDRKTEPNHPDYKGNCEIAGVEYWISGWIKEGKSGKFLSLSYKPKDQQQQGTASQQQADDDVGF